MTVKHYDAIIVGAGSMGMAAGYYLAKQGIATLLIDASDPPHQLGSHHGDTRIIRHAYGEGERYVPLTIRAKELWSELEEESGQTLFVQTGVLNAGPAPIPFIQQVRQSAERFSLPMEVLAADELSRRWPGIQVPDDFIGCFEPTSGVLYSEECIRAYRRLALRHGAELLTYERVKEIQARPDGAVVVTGQGAYSCDKLLVSAGAWNPDLLSPLGLSLPLTPTRKTVSWYDADEELYREGRFPAFIFQLPDAAYYGFPSIAGAGVKIGRHDGGLPVHPDGLDRTFGTDPADEADTRSFLERFMPRAAGPLRQGRVCLYTFTPDEDFIIDQHPAYRHIVIVAGFSGHGFKFASTVGEAASQLLLHGASEHNLSPFAINRWQREAQG